MGGPQSEAGAAEVLEDAGRRTLEVGWRLLGTGRLPQHHGHVVTFHLVAKDAGGFGQRR